MKAVFLLLLLCACTVVMKPCSHPITTRGGITCVIDGDTVRLADGTSVRLIGIDTPERGKPGYANATDVLVVLLNNTEVRLEKDISETDAFGRQLRYLYGDDTFVNEALVASGWAIANDYPPDTAHATSLHAAQDKANSTRVGLWAATSSR